MRSITGGLGSRRAKLGAAAALALAQLLATTADAQPGGAPSVDAGRDAYLAAEFEDAARRFEAVLRSPAASGPDLAEAHRYLAALRSMLGSPADAQAHIAMAVALNPDAVAPEGAPSEVEEAFAEARARGERATLSITSADPLESGARATVTATLRPALPPLATLDLDCTSGEARATERGAAPSLSVTLELRGDEARCEARALTDAGAAALAASWEQAVLGSADVAGGDDGPIVAGVLGGVAGALAVAGAVVLIAVLTSGGGGDQATLDAPTVVGW